MYPKLETVNLKVSKQNKTKNPAADPAEILKKNLNELNLYKSYLSSKAIKSKLS